SIGNVGGLVGSMSNRTSISKSYSTGAIIAIGSPSVTNVGGLVGFTEGNSNATDSYWDIETSGYSESDGGTGKTTAELKIESTFINYDFTNIWGIDPNINDGYPYLRDGSGGLLPIKLEYFEAELFNNSVELTWQTSAEINNDYFTIERSNNGIDFKVVTTIEGAGNSSESHFYSYTDANILSGISYYRLKQTDFDGKFEYSDIVSITSTSEAAIAETSIDVYPNPNNGNFSISINSDKITCYSILDSTGRIVSNGTLNSFENNIDISNMPSGIYFLMTGNSNDFSNTTRIIVN
ncbi:MAG TPA: T9SS type A sorting domain-containing protein, partial [Bacteroidales bacterium]|nr:T9SS type A sorting domain-containing protein [Bacteroidales bacterium]